VRVQCCWLVVYVTPEQELPKEKVPTGCCGFISVHTTRTSNHGACAGSIVTNPNAAQVWRTQHIKRQVDAGRQRQVMHGHMTRGTRA